MQKFLANAIVFITAGSLSLSTIVLAPQAKSQEIEKVCQSAIRDAKQCVERRRSITVMTETVDRSQLYPNHPDGRPLIVEITLDGNAADSVMNSPVFQKAITSEIINSCGSVGGVSFGRRKTDWYLTFGLMPNGTIQSFECVDPNPEINGLTWGQQICL